MKASDMGFYKIKKTGRRIPLLIGVDQNGKPVLSFKEGKDEIVLGERIAAKELPFPTYSVVSNFR